VSRRAFSQVEILVAVAILGVGLLAVVGVLGMGLKSSKYSQQHTALVAHARQAIDLIRARGWAFQPAMEIYFQDAPTERTPLQAAPFEEDFSDEGYRRNLFIERLSPDPASFENSVARIRVTLYYQGRQVTLESLQREP